MSKLTVRMEPDYLSLISFGVFAAAVAHDSGERLHSLAIWLRAAD